MLFCIRSMEVVSSEVALDVLELFDCFVETLPAVVLEATEVSDFLFFATDFFAVPVVESPSVKFVD